MSGSSDFPFLFREWFAEFTLFTPPTFTSRGFIYFVTNILKIAFEFRYLDKAECGDSFYNLRLK